MPYQVSRFGPQTRAFAPNLGHWSNFPWTEPLLIWPKCPAALGKQDTVHFFTEVTLAGKKRELPQHVARRDRFPRHVLGNCEANDVAGSGNILQKPNYLVGRHPPPWNIGQRVRRCVWVVKQHRAKFLRIENINIEMNGKVSDAFAGNPIQHWRRTVGQRVRPSAAKTELVDY